MFTILLTSHSGTASKLGVGEGVCGDARQIAVLVTMGLVYVLNDVVVTDALGLDAFCCSAYGAGIAEGFGFDVVLRDG